MLVKRDGVWLPTGINVKVSKGWSNVLTGFVKVPAGWRKFYNDLYSMSENFETTNHFTVGTLAATRETTSAYSGTYGLFTDGGIIHQYKVSESVLEDLEGTYYYEAMVRPETTDPTSLPGLVFCASGDQVGNCYSIRVDPRNGSGSTSGFQIRNGAEPATLLVSSHPTISYNQWYRVKATHNQKTGLIVAVLEDVDGVELSRLSVVNQDRKGGRYGVIGFGKASFDNVLRKLVV